MADLTAVKLYAGLHLSEGQQVYAKKNNQEHAACHNVLLHNSQPTPWAKLHFLLSIGGGTPPVALIQMYEFVDVHQPICRRSWMPVVRLSPSLIAVPATKIDLHVHVVDRSQHNKFAINWCVTIGEWAYPDRPRRDMLRHYILDA